jgi:hypothetical protein
LIESRSAKCELCGAAFSFEFFLEFFATGLYLLTLATDTPFVETN